MVPKWSLFLKKVVPFWVDRGFLNIDYGCNLLYAKMNPVIVQVIITKGFWGASPNGLGFNEFSTISGL